MPFGLQPLHIVIIVAVALIIFVPSRLPEITRGVGKTLSEFRKGMRGEPDPTEPPIFTQTGLPIYPQASQPGVYPPKPIENAVYCGLCRTVNPSSARFCSKCGSPLPKLYPDDQV